MRIQFSVNDEELKALRDSAKKFGYPDVQSYCRDIVLGERTYGLLWKSVVEQISRMPSGTVFMLRDLIDAPPANLGIALYNHQQELGIKVLRKDATKTNVFIKL